MLEALDRIQASAITTKNEAQKVEKPYPDTSASFFRPEPMSNTDIMRESVSMPQNLIFDDDTQSVVEKKQQ